MTKTQRFKKVLDMEKTREKEAAQVLVDVRRKVQQREEQLQRLGAYRDDYAQRTGETSSVRLIESRIFLGNINKAIRGQEKLLEADRKDEGKRLAEWQRQRGQVKSMESVVSRAELELRAESLRKEQREGDEQGQRLANRQSQGSMSGMR